MEGGDGDCSIDDDCAVAKPRDIAIVTVTSKTVRRGSYSLVYRARPASLHRSADYHSAARQLEE
jgi:hypothetical protein